MTITSASNPRVKAVVALRKPRERRATGRFVIEGRREVARAAVSSVGIETAYVCGELGVTPDEVAALAAGGAEIVDVGREAFERMSVREGPDGVLAVARSLDTSLARLDLPPDPLVLVMAGIEKPGNLGTMVRSALAAGADAIVVADPVVDVENPNVIRASQGALFDAPLAVASEAETRQWLADGGITTFAADPDAALPYWEAPFDRAAAIVIGAEHAGLSSGWRDAATLVSIPMSGRAGVDSLNASAAAAVLLFDAARRRADRTPVR